MSKELLQCYNRGCGQKYDPNSNTEKSCQHHPGEPFFHDAYKGWTCCSKKCTDFTEFLNIKGCTFSKHSNVKPLEPEKPKTETPEEVIEVKPIQKTTLTRPPASTELITLTPIVSPMLRKQLEDVSVTKEIDPDAGISIGTACKNRGCKVTYEGNPSEEIPCVYHPGVPIFHEGMKYWSCCQRKTTDFEVFLSQAGCERGAHVWSGDDGKMVPCRWDFHQTGTHVVVSIYAKQYCPDASSVRMNPVRLAVKVVFPGQATAQFNLDTELFGIVDVAQSKVNMFGTKVEINMRKAEACNWPRLELSSRPRQSESLEEITPKVEGVDLSDL